MIGKAVDERDLLRNQLEDYVRHDGKVFTTQSLAINCVFLIYGSGSIEWIPDCLFSSSEPWLVDDFSSLHICLIGAVALVDAGFRDRLKKELASYRSPAFSNRAQFNDNLFETAFGTAIVESHFHKLEQRELYGFLALLCRTGSSSMVKFFVDMGVDINGGDPWYNLLGHAAAKGNMEVVNMLLEADANTSSALYKFLHDSDHLSDELFKRLLEILVDKARPASFDPWQDPFISVLRKSRALVSHPKAPEILLTRNVFSDIGFGRGSCQTHYIKSYMYQAISRRNPSVVDLLLQNGAHANTRISNQFECFGFWFESCTWITCSVMCGAASCADILIQHGADVTALDGSGRSAVQLAKMNAFASHPRFAINPLEIGIFAITAEQDAETLAVLERAFNLRFQGTKSLDDHIKLSAALVLQPLPPKDKPWSMLRKTLNKFLGIYLTPTQTKTLHKRLRGLFFEIKKAWSLSFYEALLVRLIYVLSYTLLLGLEILAFTKGHKRFPTPSRSLLSAVAVLMLALAWDSTALQNPETDS